MPIRIPVPRPIVNRNAIIERMPEIGKFLQESGLVEATLKFKDDVYSISGKTKGGRTLVISMQQDDVYTERTVATANKMDASRRKIEAKKLRKRGLTQEQIAIRLGVSQKTISMDLAG